MKGSARIGTVSGIGIFVHWTFWILLGGLFAWYMYLGATVVAAIMGIVLVLAVFGCVILHELGHAMAARRYGIPTLDITMYPIGGVARLQRIPREPKQELVIALAGPAVNLGIAALLALLGGAGQGADPLWMVMSGDGGMLEMLMWINLALVGFNMIPAFPMDGGRVFRAGLATWTDYRRATHIASLVGIVMAIGMIIYGVVTFNPALPFVGLFVMFAGRQEVAHVMETS
ncbi:MAG: site-2 protease family protein [Rhodothermales bacterium]|nr:site-2 protease family protein [Rhodothermales bacterium]MBO6778205.1 site-2 protease family protein [Rhodothermales bacterium]